MVENKINVISVGDIVTDAFIKLKDDQASVVNNDQGSFLSMIYGSKLPYDYVEVIESVGNAANAAVAFAKLNLNSSLITNVGDDDFGRDMIRALGTRQVDTRFVRINAGKKSNYHYVLWYKDDRTILIKHEEYKYVWPHIDDNEMPTWIYLSSVSQHAIDYHDKISDWLDQNPDVKLAFQPGTFQMEAGTERLKRIYQRSEVLILNREEAVTVGGGNHEDVHDLINKLHDLGPKIVVVTDGPNGAYASNGSERFSMPLYPDPKPPVDRTGAGDAFASTFVWALMRNNSLEMALQFAPINSMNVVQHVGAQGGLLSQDELENYLRNSPDWYRPSKF